MENNWLRQDGKPTLITGPCSAETEEQVLDAAKQLAKDPRVDYFRAGIWKPRTRPGSFEGIGKEGLEWLKLAKQEFGLKTATEVATPEHIEQALKADIDLLWVGARTTVNPFAVQEVADALKGTDKVVLIKNPLNPDLALWIGSMERLQNAGINKLGVIHRGFSLHGNTKYRNQPLWKIPIEFKRNFPQIPIICDPSHILGSRDGLWEIAQDALNLKFEGLMIEAHPTPDQAWSDATQQVTPSELIKILDALELRDIVSKDGSFKTQIGELRDEINEVDDQLLQLLAQRMTITNKIGHLKHDHNVAVLQTSRWGEILKEVVSKSIQLELNPKFTEAIFKEVHQESVKLQNDIVNELSEQK